MPSPFPRLTNPTFTSPATDQYNCIAWAFSNNSRWWWPKRGYWPLPVNPSDSVVDAFEALFAHDGWVETDNRTLEDGFSKIALYSINGIITHAARQLATGEWTSKLGRNVDIAHAIDEVEGPQYGTIFRIYKKPIAQP
jgi:hypothetical protein